jgi:hypothetical protein
VLLDLLSQIVPGHTYLIPVGLEGLGSTRVSPTLNGRGYRQCLPLAHSDHGDILSIERCGRHNDNFSSNKTFDKKIYLIVFINFIQHERIVITLCIK